MIVAPLAAAIVQMAISRTREYAADRRGAEICGNPLWLASALDKIARNVQRIHNDDAERNPATAPSVHHQSADRRAHGQSVLDPSRTRRTASPRCRRWRRNSAALTAVSPRTAARRLPLSRAHRRLKVRGAAPARAGRGPRDRSPRNPIRGAAIRPGRAGPQRSVVVSATPAAAARVAKRGKQSAIRR